MTENEAKAVRFIEYIKKYAVETIDHIAKEDIIASTVTYTHKKEKAETILAMVEELEKYRAIGTPEECRAAVKKQNVNKELESHDEKRILECCISLMQEMVNEFAEWYRWQHGEDVIEELDEENRFCFKKSYFSIVQELFLSGTHHSGGTSTRAKCEQLGVDSAEKVKFEWIDEE